MERPIGTDLALSEMERWIAVPFAVAGAFFVGGLLGAAASRAFGVWELPGAGFVAALGVVCAAYLVAPKAKLRSGVVVFVLGAALAWRLVGHSFYPENYGEKAYQPTLLPFTGTCLGGLVGLAVSATATAWKGTRGARRADSVDE